MRVDDILSGIARITTYVDDLDFDQFRVDQKTVDAVVRNLEVIGEAARHLVNDPECRLPEVEWADIAGMRNILIHEYFGVDLAIVWETVKHDLPLLRVQLEATSR
jgi:uncharacterized protein with HEPN domain